MLIQPVRGYFQNDIVNTCFSGFFHIRLQSKPSRCSNMKTKIRRFIINDSANRRDKRSFVAALDKNVIEQTGSCCFTVSTGNADHFHSSGRKSKNDISTYSLEKMVNIFGTLPHSISDYTTQFYFR